MPKQLYKDYNLSDFSGQKCKPLKSVSLLSKRYITLTVGSHTYVLSYNQTAYKAKEL